MSLKTKWISAALALGAVIACMKAGDGVGLDNAGRVCTDNSKDSACVPYINPCIAHPSLPSCKVDPCVTNATSKACSTSMCEKDSSHAWCHQQLQVDCAATPTVQVCVDSCTANPALAWCAPPKTKFTEVYALITSSTCLTCHIPGAEGVTTGKLNMASIDSAYANLVGVLATDQTLAPGWVRVKPGNPDSSIFYLKLTNAAASLNLKLPNGTQYGLTMPKTGAPFLKAKLDVIKKWILDGAVK